MTKKIKTNSDINQRSRDWSGNQWELYLRSLESPCKEVLISPEHFDHLAETKSIYKVFKDRPVSEDHFSPTSLIRDSIKVLSKNERKAIVGIYWDGLTQEELAEKLQVSPQTIHTFKARALKKIKNFMSLNSQAFLESELNEIDQIA